MTRARALPVALLAAAVVTTTSGASRGARADEPRPRATLLQRARASSDLLDTAPTIAAVEGTWSIMLQAGTLMSTRAWLGPYPRGLAAHVATRALYGSTWSLMLASETLLALTLSGGSFAWLGEVHYRADQLFGLAAPAGCGAFGANGGCGVGLGSFAGLHARLAGSRLWLEVSGGWLQQRVGTDAQRTLGESTWVMTPIGITAEGVVNRGGAVELRAVGGPHLQFGMHNAHVHPTALGDETLSVPWTELFPLHTGLGPGARAEVRLVLGQRVSLDLEGVFTPLLLSSTEEHPRAVLAPLGPTTGQGLPTWRRVAIGASYIDRAVRVGFSFYGAELSGRPVTTLGHQAIALRLDFPLGLDAAGPAK